MSNTSNHNVPLPVDNTFRAELPPMIDLSISQPIKSTKSVSPRLGTDRVLRLKNYNIPRLNKQKSAAKKDRLKPLTPFDFPLSFPRITDERTKRTKRPNVCYLGQTECANVNFSLASSLLDTPQFVIKNENRQKSDDDEVRQIDLETNEGHNYLWWYPETSFLELDERFKAK